MKANKNDLHESGRVLTKEEFINKIKTDDEFAKKWGDLGPVYGAQWRSWGYEPQTDERGYGIKGIDQIANLINDLKTNPDSRRLMVNAWNVGELDQMVLPPCHYGFQVYTRELSRDERCDIAEHYGYDSRKLAKPTAKQLDEANIPTRAISLMWNQRSVDTFLGLPFNIASYGLLLEIIAKEVNMVPDELIGNLGDTHLYLNHIEQAKEQIGREVTEKDLSEKMVFISAGYIQEDGSVSEKGHEKINEMIQNLPKRTREPYPLPKLGEIPDYLCMKDNWKCYEPSDFTLENYQSHPSIKAPLSN